MLLMVTNMPPASHGQMICIIYIKPVAHVYNHVLVVCPGPVSYSVRACKSEAYKKTKLSVLLLACF